MLVQRILHNGVLARQKRQQNSNVHSKKDKLKLQKQKPGEQKN